VDTAAATTSKLPACLLAVIAVAAFAPALAAAAPPDPLARGPYTPTTIEQAKLGTVDLQEPNANGNAPTGASAAATVQLRGQMFYPADRASGSPIVILVHGNHGACEAGSAPNCTVFQHNDRGYAYLGENLATSGYTVFSIDQDQLIFYQDGTARGMHQRRLIISAALDALYKLNQAAVPVDANNNVGGALVGKLDFARIGLMGHSRGGDGVADFLDWNRTRPAPGRRYTGLRGVIALAPTDYERRAPWGVPFLSILPACDGDVSNLMGARFFERGQYVKPGDPFPRVQFTIQGTNHNWFNTVWATDADDSTTSDPACSTNGATNPSNIRLSPGEYTRVVGTDTGNFASADPALMGDQEKTGLATMASFFRRYVGSELGFDPYMTAELSEDGTTPQLPASACPSQTASGTRISCFDRMKTNYFAAPADRRDVIRPEPDDPLDLSAMGTSLTGGGFSNPYTNPGGVNPIPATTPGGYDWCNPEPNHFTPTAVGETGNPTAFKGCPLPTAAGLGGQNGARENAPVNRSYGLQLALAWDDPVTNTGSPAKLATRIPSELGDESGYKTLALSAAVNYFDPRNPSRGTQGLWDPSFATQDFTIAVTDASGKEGTVAAGSRRYGTALQQTVGNTTARVHVILQEIRVPLGDFTAQGVDVSKLRKLELRFGEAGKPVTGSIELSDVRFQESAAGPSDFATAFEDEAREIEATPSVPNPDVVWVNGPAATLAASPSAKACAAPTARILSKRTKGGRLVLTGTAKAASCAGKVKTVGVTVYSASTAGRCRFLDISGKLGARKLPCASPVSLVAKGTTRWTLKTKGKLAKGRYLAYVRAIDAAGGRQAVAKPIKIEVAS
jgi:dienelactone hydrolase